jgi:hypothetical protein
VFTEFVSRKENVKVNGRGVGGRAQIYKYKINRHKG